MKQFTLKFTEENLKRHLAYNPDVIVTTRDERKAEIGDVCIIKDRVYKVTNTHRVGDLSDARFIIGREIAQESGFKSWSYYRDEIIRIYGSPKRVYYIYTLTAVDVVNLPTLASRVDDVEKTVRYLQNLLHDHLQEMP